MQCRRGSSVGSGRHRLQQVLLDTAASGRRRRVADADSTGVITELVAREWMDWDDECLVLTSVGQKALFAMVDQTRSP